MQYPYTLALNLIFTTFITLIGCFIFSSAVKRINNIGEIYSIKMILGYLITSFLIYLLYPYPLFNNLESVELPLIVDFFAYLLILLFVFSLLAKMVLFLNFKEILVFFFLFIFIIFPTLGFLNDTSIKFFQYIEPFKSELVKIEQENETIEEGEKTERNLLLVESEELQSGLLNWPVERLLKVVEDLK